MRADECDDLRHRWEEMIDGGYGFDPSDSDIVRGILLKDDDMISTAQNGMTDVLDYVTTGNGFYDDGSYTCHGGSVTVLPKAT